MDLQTIERSATRCVDKTKVKANERIRNAGEDDLIDLWIAAAEEHAEKQMNRPIMPTSYRLTIGRVLPMFSLPRPNFLSFASLTYQVEGEAEVTVDTAGLTPRYIDMLPTFELDVDEADGLMTIEYTAGWADATAVPSSVKQAVILLASHWYRAREATFFDPRGSTPTKLPYGFDTLISKYTVPNNNTLLNGGY